MSPSRPQQEQGAPHESPSREAPVASSPAPFQQLQHAEARPYTRGEYLCRAMWLVVQHALIRWSPPRAYGWRRFWLRRFGAVMDDTACTRPRAWIIHPWLLTMQRYTMLADDACIYNLGPVHIGEQTLISQGAYLCAGTHDHTQPHLPLKRTPIHVGRGVWICAQAFVGPGVRIGDNSIVGARAVVVRDVPAGVIAAGNPAQVKKPREMGRET